jgi:hypothetical protein
MLSSTAIATIVLSSLAFLVLTGYGFRLIRRHFRDITNEREALTMYLSNSRSEENNINSE